LKAAILTKLNQPLEIVDVNIPPLQYGHVLVKIFSAGLCGSQLSEIKGYKDNEKFLPHMMGHEGGGIVKDVGPNVTKVKVGDRVVMHWRKGSGIEAPYVKYGNIGAGKVTTFSEYAVVSENRITKVSDNILFDICALMGCAITTGFGAVYNNAKLQSQERVLILGCGGIGSSILLSCFINGNMVDILDTKFKSVYNEYYCRGKFYKNLHEIKDNYDVIFDTIGSPDIFEFTINKLFSKGRYILIGQPQPNTSFIIPNIMTLFEGEGKQIIASQGGQTEPDKDISKYCNLYKKYSSYFHKLISHTFPLNQINHAINLLRTNNCKRIIIRCQT